MAARTFLLILSIILTLGAIGIASLWIGNHENARRGTYAAMSHGWDDPYQPPTDTGILIYSNGFYLFADQRRGAPKPTIFIHYGLLIGLMIIFPIWYIPRYVTESRHRSRESRGLCWQCAYDLRMTPDRCPECGEYPRNHQKELAP